MSTISRNVSRLSKWEKHKVAGLDLIINDTDPMDRRRRVMTLTAKGKRLFAGLKDTISE